MNTEKQFSCKKIFIVFCIFISIFILISCIKPQNKNNFAISNADVEAVVDITPHEVKALAKDASNSAELILAQILSSPSSVFTNTKGEADALANTILAHKQDFLKDLENVLSHDTDNMLLLADKKNYLDESYIPHDLVPLTANDTYKINRNDLSLRIPVEQSLRKMADDAKIEGISILVSSTYRSFEYQKNLYERNVKQLGKDAADRESAQPGTSQHQLGTAIDFGSITDEFALTKAGKWLDLNAGNYGFSLSYPEGYESVTGYRWECWHYRYIGIEAVQFQKKWFKDVQQYMLEFIHYWKKASSNV